MCSSPLGRQPQRLEELELHTGYSVDSFATNLHLYQKWTKLRLHFVLQQQKVLVAACTILHLSQEGHGSSFPSLLVLLYKFVNANKGKVMKILYMQLIEHYFVEQKVEVDLFHVTY